MKNFYLFLFISLSTICFAQPPQITIHFDDTTYQNYITIDTSSAKVWQIGKPQKTLFDSAYNTPNVIVTDTSNFYPTNDTSSFILNLGSVIGGSSSYELSFRQKIDFEKKADGGVILVKCNDSLWHNVFDNNPYCISVYGFSPWTANNLDTLNNGFYGFTGIDTTWQKISLGIICNASRLKDKSQPFLELKFIIFSDSNQTNQEGWMIDDIRFYDYGGTCSSIEEFNQAETLNIFPNPTYDISYLDLSNLIKGGALRVSIVNLLGEEVQSYYTSEALTKLSFKDFPSGIYQIMVFEEDKIIGKSKIIKY